MTVGGSRRTRIGYDLQLNVRRSGDGGRRWTTVYRTTRVGTELEGVTVGVVPGSHTTSVLAWAFGGIVWSADGGVSWSRLRIPSPHGVLGPIDGAAFGSTAGTIFVLMGGGSGWCKNTFHAASYQVAERRWTFHPGPLAAPPVTRVDAVTAPMSNHAARASFYLWGDDTGCGHQMGAADPATELLRYSP